MNDSTILRAAILFSMGLHSFLLVPIPLLSPFSAEKAKLKSPPKVSYLVVSKENTLKSFAQKTTVASPRKVFAAKDRIKRTSYQRQRIKEKIKIEQPPIKKSHPPKTKVADPDIATFGKAMDEWKATRAEDVPDDQKKTYQSYYQSIRNAIGLSIKENYLTRFKDSDIMMTFVINKKGQLVGARVTGSRGADNHLRTLALKSLKDASPYPEFPKGLQMNQVMFNITVHFKKG